MSTDFIPGQNARAIRTTTSKRGVEVVKNAEVTVEAYFGGREFMARLEAEDGLIFSVDDFEPVEPPKGWGGSRPLAREDFKAADATPAPLNPSKVKAGDTVTLESGTALVRDVVIEAKSRGVGQFVFYTAESPDPLIPGTYYLVNHGAWTLTEHQPAPEPETVWEPKTVAIATAEDVPGWWLVRLGNEWRDSHGHVMQDGLVTDVRPLVVIDPERARALVRDHFDDDRSRALLDALLDGAS